jgi:hypothetical protein
VLDGKGANAGGAQRLRNTLLAALRRPRSRPADLRGGGEGSDEGLTPRLIRTTIMIRGDSSGGFSLSD